MKAFLRRISPVRGVKDFAHEFARPNPYRWQVLALSVALTFFILMVFIPADQRIEPRRPDVTYITTFAEGRSDEEIVASNIANQERQDQLRAEAKEREEFRKDLYRALGKATGLDTDAMEREIAEEQAAEQAATPPNTVESAPSADGSR